MNSRQKRGPKGDQRVAPIEAQARQLVAKKRGRPPALSAADAKAIDALFAQGYKIRDVALMLGVSPDCVADTCARHGIKTPRQRADEATASIEAALAEYRSQAGAA